VSHLHALRVAPLGEEGHMARHRNRRISALAVVCLAALATAGCLQDPNAGGSSGGAGGEVFADGGTADGDGTVEILGAFGGAEQEAFEKSLTKFEDESGITIEYTASTDFTTIVKSRVQGGDTPDIALFPQPGGLTELAADNHIQPIDTFLDYDGLDDTLIPGFFDSVRLNGRVYGAPMRMAVKSIVWVPKDEWEKRGYTLEPESIQELEKIADEIKADGIAPWCIGYESDQATGWVGTDWIEEYVLRVGGPEVYDDWVEHKIPFDDPQIKKAFDAYGEISQTQGNVFGGADGILNTPFAEAMNPALQDPPKCMMMRQGNFAISFFSPEVQQNLDDELSIMYFPPYDGGFGGTPVLGGGDLAALFNGNDEDAITVMEFLTSDQFGAEWAQAGGWLSPHTTFDVSNYPNDTTRRIAEIANSADIFRFDASDLMPKEVGSGTFWTGMVEWHRGKSTDQVTADIESSWPTS
jgi:alpha-glucoside transport system substrate-binding protein